jgi:hypothetical protein
VVALLALEVIFGAEEWIHRWPRPSANPHLHISMWRPLWTVATPLMWIAMLLNGERKAAAEAAHGAAEQADAADEAGASDGASQLIRSVRWTQLGPRRTRRPVLWNATAAHRTIGETRLVFLSTTTA